MKRLFVFSVEENQEAASVTGPEFPQHPPHCISDSPHIIGHSFILETGVGGRNEILNKA